MSTREIVSLQFGHYSNFIGTHWWNIQETSFEYNAKTPSEINHDVLFREGLTNKGQTTFTPRLLLADLKGSLKSLPESGILYEPTPSSSKTEFTDQPHEIKEEEKQLKNVFQEDLDNLENPRSLLKRAYNLDDDVKVWSDFLYSQFHPRTVNIIKEYEHESKHSQFDVFPSGTNMWKHNQFQDTFSDKIRQYIEECDSFQGFHITLDATNAFAGLSSSCIEYLRDEYETKPVLCFPVFPAHYSDYLFSTDAERLQSLMNDCMRTLNTALCFDALNEHSSLFIPLCTSKNGWRQPGPARDFHRVLYDHKLSYHTSAILASALDTLTLKHRLKSTNYSISDLCADFNVHGRKAAAASLCLPFSFNKGNDLIDCLDQWEGPLTQSITPSCSIGSDKLVQTMILRGISEDRLKRPLKQAGKQLDMPAYNCQSVSEMLNLYLSCNNFMSISNVTTATQGMSVKTPYPNIFDKFVDTDGNINNVPRQDHTVIESIPVLAGLHSGVGCGVGDMIESLHKDTKKIKFGRFHQFTASGLESQEFTECLDRLLDLKECYEDNYFI